MEDITSPREAIPLSSLTHLPGTHQSNLSSRLTIPPLSADLADIGSNFGCVA